MKKSILGFLTTVLFLASAQAATYNVDESHSVVGFSVKHLVVSKAKGRFNKFSGSFDFDEKKNEVSKIDVKIDVTSVDTNEKKRDEHLSSADFFDVKNHPSMTFVADKVVVKKDKAVAVKGNLTIKGITKPVTLDLTYGGSIVDPWGNQKVGFSLSGKIHRKDWGLNWNKTLDKGGLAVGEDVTLEIEGEAAVAKTAEAKPTEVKK